LNTLDNVDNTENKNIKQHLNNEEESGKDSDSQNKEQIEEDSKFLLSSVIIQGLYLTY